MRTKERQESPKVTAERDRLLTERATLRQARQQHHADERQEHVLAERMRLLDERIAGLGTDEQVELPCSTWLPQGGTDPVGPGSWWCKATRDDKRAFFRLFLDRTEVCKAYRYAGQSVPAESRVSITWAGGIDLDVLP